MPSRNIEKLDDDTDENIDDDELFRLDDTLESDSRFVFPDGKSFVPNVSRVTDDAATSPGVNIRTAQSSPKPEPKYISLSSKAHLDETELRKLQKLKKTLQAMQLEPQPELGIPINEPNKLWLIYFIYSLTYLYFSYSPFL